MVLSSGDGQSAVLAVSPEEKAPRWRRTCLAPRQALRGRGTWFPQSGTFVLAVAYLSRCKSRPRSTVPLCAPSGSHSFSRIFSLAGPSRLHSLPMLAKIPLLLIGPVQLIVLASRRTCQLLPTSRFCRWRSQRTPKTPAIR